MLGKESPSSKGRKFSLNKESIAYFVIVIGFGAFRTSSRKAILPFFKKSTLPGLFWLFRCRVENFPNFFYIW